jgi:hypothetical protein
MQICLLYIKRLLISLFLEKPFEISTDIRTLKNNQISRPLVMAVLGATLSRFSQTRLDDFRSDVEMASLIFDCHVHEFFQGCRRINSRFLKLWEGFNKRWERCSDSSTQPNDTGHTIRSGRDMDSHA